jgi:hypothetical protein
MRLYPKDDSRVPGAESYEWNIGTTKTRFPIGITPLVGVPR